MEPLIGKAFGQYQIVGEIGRGGMAIVYKAYQSKLDRYVALKVLPPQFAFDPEFVKRLELEAKAAAKLKHPNIVTIFDVG
ncbi:MAG: serine/threonine protein kinase, partial [Chloroflexota bacterium]|nr:serine/threonine protein kinase [Chloroflexota bacterium]